MKSISNPFDHPLVLLRLAYSTLAIAYLIASCCCIYGLEISFWNGNFFVVAISIILRDYVEDNAFIVFQQAIVYILSYEYLVKRFPKIQHFKYWRNLQSEISFCCEVVMIVFIHSDNNIPSLVQILNSMVLLFILTAKAAYSDLDIFLPYLISKMDHRSSTVNLASSTQQQQSSSESVFTFTGFSEPLGSSSSSAIQGSHIIWSVLSLDVNLKMLAKSYVYGNNFLFKASAPLSPGSGRTPAAATLVSRLGVSDLTTVAAVMYVSIVEGLFLSYVLTIAPLLSTVLPANTSNMTNSTLMYNFQHVCILAVTFWIAASCLMFIILYLKNILPISLELRRKVTAAEKANEEVSLTILDSLILSDITGSKEFGVQLGEAVVPTLAACILAAVGILDCILCAVSNNKRAMVFFCLLGLVTVCVVSSVFVLLKKRVDAVSRTVGEIMANQAASL